MPLANQIDRGVLTQPEADHLLEILMAGRGLVIAAGDSGSGKSSLLWSLVASLPITTERIFIRGSAEPFDFVHHRHDGPRLMLVNELSPFLPTYCWGASARRVVSLIDAGFGFAATMHARNRTDIEHTFSSLGLRSSPLELTCAQLEPDETKTGINRIDRLQTVTLSFAA